MFSVVFKILAEPPRNSKLYEQNFAQTLKLAPTLHFKQ